MAVPDYQRPFVVPVLATTRQRLDTIDVYRPRPAEGDPRPVVVFVHGGPVPADLRPTPRDWPVYVGYGSLAAGRGLIGVTVDHRLHDSADYPVAAADVAAAAEQARSLAGVDEERVALWFFSGGGLLMADWLDSPPAWLCGVAATYPILAPLPDRPVHPRFQPARTVSEAGDLPILLTRVGQERAEIAATVESFVTAAAAHNANLEVIDVPSGQHGFDMFDSQRGLPASGLASDDLGACGAIARRTMSRSHVVTRGQVGASAVPS